MNFDQAIAERVEEQRLEAEKETANRLLEENRRLALLVGQYDRLSENEDFQWWRDTVLLPRIKAAHDAALDTAEDVHKAREQACRYEALNGLLVDFERERTRLINKMEATK